MNEPSTFADLCREYVRAVEKLGRLESLPPGSRPADYAELLESLRAYRVKLHAAIKVVVEQAL